jgi:hypothetical protein
MGKSSFDTLYAFDKDLAEKGARMYVGPNANGDDIYFVVAKSGNTENEKERMRKQKRLQATRFNKEVHNKVIAEVVAKTILLNWENVLDKNGDPLPATYENRLQALIDYPELFEDVVLFSADNANFVGEDEDPEAEVETEKN